MQTEERIARIEAQYEELRAQMCEMKAELKEELKEIKTHDIKEIKEAVKDIQEKLNGYLTNRVKAIVWEMLGKGAWAILTSSAVISVLISWLLRR